MFMSFEPLSGIRHVYDTNMEQKGLCNMTKIILILFLIMNISICTGKENLLPGSDMSIKNSLQNSMILPVSKAIMYDVPLIAKCMAAGDATHWILQQNLQAINL